MKLENQVVNLELSKRLKELGVKQDSLWYHVNIVTIGRKNKYERSQTEAWCDWDNEPCLNCGRCNFTEEDQGEKWENY